MPARGGARLKEVIHCLLAVVSSVALATSAASQTVYVIPSCDTSIWWNTSGGYVHDYYIHEFDFDVFTNRHAVVAEVMSATFRNDHQDSRGQTFKLSWFMHGGGWFQVGTNSTAITPLYLIKEYWSPQLESWGDELAYHFHHFDWNGTQWVMAATLLEELWDFEWTLAQMVIDEGVYPVSFRSGWNYMDTSYQLELEKWMPYRLEGGSWMSGAVPYHPSFTNYQVPGSMKGWEVRHYYTGSFSQSVSDQMFSAAGAGTDQVVCIWSHQNEPTFPQQWHDVHTRLENSAATYPAVEFLYGTARDMMRQWQGADDEEAPPLDLSLQRTATTADVTIHTATDIYPVTPLVAARRATLEYELLAPTLVEPGKWQFEYLLEDYDRIVVGVCDIYGNVSLKEVKDGHRAWTTQSEFASAERSHVDIEQRVNDVILALETETVPTVDQRQKDSLTPTLNRGYWIGQTFVPTQGGLSGVELGANVSGGPVEILVELRSVAPDGFPDERPEGLLASGVASLVSSGTAVAALSYSGLVLDGRAYVLVFRQGSGTATLRMSSTNVYPSGTLVRAFGGNWITIDFDCYFRTFDQDGFVDQSQTVVNAETYVLRKGVFLAQTFDSGTMQGIAQVDFAVEQSDPGESLDIELRRTLPLGVPDPTAEGLLDQSTVSVNGPGIYSSHPNWSIPPSDQGQLLAIVFSNPASDNNSVRLGHSAADTYPGGQYIAFEDLSPTYPGGDLYLGLYGITWASTGTLTWDFDAEALVQWTEGVWSATAELGESTISARFKFADSQGALDTASWSASYTQCPFSLEQEPRSRWMRAEVLLQSLLAGDSPVLSRFEIYYEPPTTAVPVGLWQAY